MKDILLKASTMNELYKTLGIPAIVEAGDPVEPHLSRVLLELARRSAERKEHGQA